MTFPDRVVEAGEGLPQYRDRCVSLLFGRVSALYLLALLAVVDRQRAAGYITAHTMFVVHGCSLYLVI